MGIEKKMVRPSLKGCFLSPKRLIPKIVVEPIRELGGHEMNKERLVERFLRYVQVDSPTKEERDFALLLMEELKELGLAVHMDDAGEKVGSNAGNVVATLQGNAEGTPMLFSCHMDTVSPGRGIKPVIKEGTIYSDGTTILGGDDKAGIAAVMEALTMIKEEKLAHGDLEVVFTIYEEGGLFGAKNLDFTQFSSKMAIVLDSGGDPGDIILKGPAQNKIDVTFLGREAHAGVAPEEGISAVVMAAEAIAKMKLLRIDEETTANIGGILGGGPTNIVTKEVRFFAEARSLSDEKLKAQSDHMVLCCEEAAKKYGGQVKVLVENAYGAFSIDEDHDVVTLVKKALGTLGLPTRITTSGGGSDTNILNAHGITAINLGIGERVPHTLEEHLHIKDLVDTTRLVLEIIQAAKN